MTTARLALPLLVLALLAGCSAGDGAAPSDSTPRATDPVATSPTTGSPTEPTSEPTSGPTTGPTSGPTTELTTEPTKPVPEPTTEPGTGPTTGTTVPPSEALERIRVTGEVVSTGDCVVVRDDNGITWTVTGPGAGRLEAGARVRVTGAPDLAAEGCGGPLVRVGTIVTVE